MACMVIWKVIPLVQTHLLHFTGARSCTHALQEQSREEGHESAGNECTCIMCFSRSKGVCSITN